MSTIQVTNINDLSDNAALVTDNGGIKTDKLTGKTTAGSISVVGEGNSTTTNLQQGLAKQWVNFDSTGTLTARDSLNVASLTDNSTGNYNVNFSSNYGNNDYALTSTSRANDTFASTFEGDNTTSFARVFNIQHSDRANADSDTVIIATHGDLA